MPRITGLVALVLTCSLAGFSANVRAQQNRPHEELLQMERDWCSALLNKDAALLGRILADDYSGIGTGGQTSTKANDLAGLRGEDVVLTSCVDNDVIVRVYGDAAVVTGRARRSGTNKGAPFEREHLYTDTFIRRNGQWQCVATQATIPAAPQK